MDNPDYVFNGTSSGFDRLMLDSRILRPITERLFREAGLEQGMNVLDLGCGTGEVSILAARMVGPSGWVVGIDRAPGALSTAKSRARCEGLRQIEFEANRVEDYLPAIPFDFVIGRHVLIHQSDPTALIRAAARHLRPGGTIAFHEINLHLGYHSLPKVPAWETMAGWLLMAFRAGAPSWDAAGRLVEHFRNAGLPTPSLFAELPVGGGEDSPFYGWMAETVRSMMPKLLELGAVTEDDVSIDTLEARLRADVVAARAQIDVATQVCAWAKL